MTRFTTIAIVAALLAGCAAGPEHFIRHGASAAMREHDFLQCQYETSYIWHAVQREHSKRACMLARGYQMN